MSQLTPAAFGTKYLQKFADNEFQNITEGTFRELITDIKDSFTPAGALNAPNVPLWNNQTYYPVGEVVLWTIPGDQQRFYRALVAGYLASPSAPAGDANWQPATAPVAQLALAQLLTLAAAQGTLQSAAGTTDLVAGRLYRLDGAWNGIAGAAVYVQAIEKRQFAPTGWLSSDPVRVDVVAGTTANFSLDAGGIGTVRTVNNIAPDPDGNVNTTTKEGWDYPVGQTSVPPPIDFRVATTITLVGKTASIVSARYAINGGAPQPFVFTAGVDVRGIAIPAGGQLALSSITYASGYTSGTLFFEGTLA